MMDSSVAIWSCSRLDSQRVPNKMIRPFATSTLTDIFLSKQSKLTTDVFFSGYEDVFKQKCKEHGVRFVPRTKHSATIDEPASEIYSFLLGEPYEYFLHVNACLPFLKISTIEKFLESCMIERSPAFGVTRRDNYFVGLDGTPYNFSANLTTINTKNVSPVYEFAHVLYFFRRDYFRENGWFWDWSDVRYIEIPGGLEMFDIDTEDEFKVAEILWREIGESGIQR